MGSSTALSRWGCGSGVAAEAWSSSPLLPVAAVEQAYADASRRRICLGAGGTFLPVITEEQRSLRDGAQAFADLLEGRVDAGTIVLMAE